MRVSVPKTKALELDVIQADSGVGAMNLSSSTRRSIQWDLQDAARNISWIRGSLSAIGRNIIGPGFTFVKVKEFEDEATEEALMELKRFYGLGVKRGMTNIKDFYGTLSKLFITAFALSLGGQTGWELRSDQLLGKPLTFDFIPGYIEPQLERNGDFKTPAWKQYLSASQDATAEWSKPDDIVFFAAPDFGGYPFSSDLEALVAYTLPSEIYAMQSYLSMHKNRNAPYDGFWQLDSAVDDDTWKAVIKMINSQYKGGKNYGKNPIVAKGSLEWKPLSRNKEDAPYMEGRDFGRQEIAAVTQVPGSKLGVTGEMSRASSREAKRDYHETTIEPIHGILEETTYNQIHVNKLGIRGWMLHFNNPAFVTEVEQASIDRTNWNIGKVNANELRERDGMEPREGGDKYFEPTNMVTDEDRAAGTVGARPNEPTPNPGENNPAGQNPRPVRADEQALVDELRKWSRVEVRRAKEGKKRKQFASECLDPRLYRILETALEEAQGDVEIIKAIFDAAIAEVKSEEA